MRIFQTQTSLLAQRVYEPIGETASRLSPQGACRLTAAAPEVSLKDAPMRIFQTQIDAGASFFDPIGEFTCVNSPQGAYRLTAEASKVWKVLLQSE